VSKLRDSAFCAMSNVPDPSRILRRVSSGLQLVDSKQDKSHILAQCAMGNRSFDGKREQQERHGALLCHEARANPCCPRRCRYETLPSYRRRISSFCFPHSDLRVRFTLYPLRRETDRASQSVSSGESIRRAEGIKGHSAQVANRRSRPAGTFAIPKIRC